MIANYVALLERIRAVQAAIRDAVVAACEQSALEQLSAVVAEEAGDTIFAIDRVSEQVLLEHFHQLAAEWPMVLIAEGLGATGVAVLTPSGSPEDAAIRVIVDPIDGTRGLMYQKRSAWILTGVAQNHGEATSLADIELAVMTEIPLVRQHLCDTLWAVRGQGGQAERLNRLNGERQPLVLRPSRAATIAQGFGGLARFFPGARGVLAAIDDEIHFQVLGVPPTGKALAFEDQYISSGGQLYELLVGHDRWIADLRPLVNPLLRERGFPPGMCCHPYDLCTELIAREAGVIVTDALGGQLAARLDVESDLAWMGFANSAIRDQVAPALAAALRERGLLT
ncbi:MAG: inositol monophosphatase [Roseiflexaceae bacterium]|nr:inositol monophosphatase [Roseiflexaceae bacterium]